MLKRWYAKFSLQQRMRMLLVVSAILPLLLIWFFISIWVFNLYKQNTELLINNELDQLTMNMSNLMDSMKYMSQQLVNDEKLNRHLEDYLSGDEYLVGKTMEYLQNRVALYEAANPTIANITFFYQSDNSLLKINSSSLSKNSIPTEKFLLQSYNHVNIYGPHPTQSLVANYPVLSLLRKVPIAGVDNLYVYIESGYKKLGVFSARTLDHIKAVYTVVSNTGEIVYSSVPEVIPEITAQPVATGNKAIIHGKSYLVYTTSSNSSWQLQVYVEENTFGSYMYTLSIGFVIIALVAVGLSILMGSILWRSVQRPLQLFDRNLKSVMLDSWESDIQRINIQEFDDNFEYFEKLKKRILHLVLEVQNKEAAKSTLEIKLLMYKINPHFIHNTLNTLKWYSADKGYEDIEGFLSSLNRLLMYNMGKIPGTTLETELNSIHDYIHLQKLKYNFEFGIENTLPPSMMKAATPRFILYPLVENAILHGIRGQGTIIIRLYPDADGKIVIVIEDSGSPMEEQEINTLIANSQSPAPEGGIGLAYVRGVLADEFGAESEFFVQALSTGNAFILKIPFNVL